jgi:hypothetical protein
MSEKIGEVIKEPAQGTFDPTSFDSRAVNAIAPPLVAGLAILLRLSPLGFLLEGFHVWVHELGHASVAWMTGRKAVPLPIGWTNVEQERSIFVYFGVLLLLGTMAVYGWRERKPFPVFLAVLLVPLQAYMTWRLSEDRGHMWMIFAGVGGEFYMAAAMMGLFYFDFPEGFKWGGCRYFFLFIGAASFSETWAFWRDVKHGVEDIPYGSMIGGEGDGGGDMNILRDDYGWTQHQIIHAYSHLGDVCLVSVVVVYASFVLRLDRVVDRLLARIL